MDSAISDENVEEVQRAFVEAVEREEDDHFHFFELPFSIQRQIIQDLEMRDVVSFLQTSKAGTAVVETIPFKCYQIDASLDLRYAHGIDFTGKAEYFHSRTNFQSLKKDEARIAKIRAALLRNSTVRVLDRATVEMASWNIKADLLVEPLVQSMNELEELLDCTQAFELHYPPSELNEYILQHRRMRMLDALSLKDFTGSFDSIFEFRIPKMFVHYADDSGVNINYVLLALMIREWFEGVREIEAFVAIGMTTIGIGTRLSVPVRLCTELRTIPTFVSFRNREVSSTNESGRFVFERSDQKALVIIVQKNVLLLVTMTIHELETCCTNNSVPYLDDHSLEYIGEALDCLGYQQYKGHLLGHSLNFVQRGVEVQIRYVANHLTFTPREMAIRQIFKYFHPRADRLSDETALYNKLKHHRATTVEWPREPIWGNAWTYKLVMYLQDYVRNVHGDFLFPHRGD